MIIRMSGVSSGDDKYDINSENYLSNEIKRAFREEICNNDDGLEISVFGLVLDKKYGQWNIVGTTRTPLSSKEIIQLHSLRYDTYEVNELEFVSFVDEYGNLSLKKIEQRLCIFLREGMWSMALSAVYSALISLGFTDCQISDMTKNW